MTLRGEYEPNPVGWVQEQIETYERSGGQEAGTLRDSDMPVIIVTTRGAKSGKVRKFGLMRVEHDGEYALVASKGGAPEHPVWYHNLKAHPDEVMIQDGPEPHDYEVREIAGDERAAWWERAVAAYPPYAEYQEKTDRVIPSSWPPAKPDSVPDYQYLIYETVDDGAIAVISLNRPRQRNAQNRGLLVELDQAFAAAEADDTVRVVVLRGEGTSFSAGHDLGSRDDVAERTPGPDQHPTYASHGAGRDGIERTWRQEWHYYFTNTRRWRDLRKITIASVKGPVYAAGLMLMWACDLIVADDTAQFADVVGTRLGMLGVEYFAHPWELGARRAKELLLTGDSISADEAYRIGMVSKVFPPGRLDTDTLAFARRIAAVPTSAALMIKEAVNQTTDIQGQHNALNAVFSLHALNHAHWGLVSGGEALYQTPDLGAVPWNEAPPIRPAVKDQP